MKNQEAISSQFAQIQIGKIQSNKPARVNSSQIGFCNVAAFTNDSDLHENESELSIFNRFIISLALTKSVTVPMIMERSSNCSQNISQVILKSLLNKKKQVSKKYSIRPDYCSFSRNQINENLRYVLHVTLASWSHSLQRLTWRSQPRSRGISISATSTAHIKRTWACPKYQKKLKNWVWSSKSRGCELILRSMYVSFGYFNGCLLWDFVKGFHKGCGLTGIINFIGSFEPEWKEVDAKLLFDTEFAGSVFEFGI